MSGGSRALPDRPNLCYLRLEAKRRLAAGEFATLHDAQTAIAREYGEPSWAALKQLVQAGPDGHAVTQLRWVISRFSGADEPGWYAPGEDELRQHFSPGFLAALPPDRLIEAIGQVAADLRGDLVVIGQVSLEAQVELNGIQYIAAVEAEPPHRLIGLRGLPTGSRLRDTRTAAPAAPRTKGDVPAAVPAVADQAFAELGLPALLLAGAAPENPEPWVLAQGWADLDRSEPLDPGHRFPAPGLISCAWDSDGQRCCRVPWPARPSYRNRPEPSRCPAPARGCPAASAGSSARAVRSRCTQAAASRAPRRWPSASATIGRTSC